MSSNEELMKPDSDEQLDNTISELESEEILEYYKNIPYDYDEEKKEDLSENKKSVPMMIKNLLIPNNKRLIVSDTGDEDLHEEHYGLTQRSKSIIRYASVAVLCLIIIGASAFTAIKMPKDEAAVTSEIERLMSEQSYVSLKNEYDSAKAEVEDLTAEATEKKDFSQQLSDYENKKAALRADIDEKKTELNEINVNISSMQTELDSINEQINKNSSSIVTLSPGRYKVGENIAPGIYLVTGSGKFVVSTSGNENKLNQVLGSEPIKITLESGDNIKLETTAKFTLTN